MKEISIVEKFYKFLEENNCKDKYIQNYADFNKLSFDDARKPLYLNLCIQDKAFYIFEAFSWIKSNEGYHFWLDIDTKWDKELEEFYN